VLQGFAKFGIAHHGRKRGVASDVITRPTIQQSQAKEVRPNKSPQWPNGQPNKTGSAAAPCLLPDKLVAERNDLLQVRIDRFTTVVMQIGTEQSDAAIDYQLIMRIDASPASVPALP
jgi:hypothetical protein